MIFSYCWVLGEGVHLCIAEERLGEGAGHSLHEFIDRTHGRSFGPPQLPR
jgi:hypothetical protein